MVRLSVGDTSRLGCRLAGLLSLWQGHVLLPGSPEDIFPPPHFFSQAVPDRWSSLYKSCVGSFVSAQIQLSLSCHGGTDWLCIIFDSLSLLSFWSQRSEPLWYRTMTVICFNLSKASKAIPEEAWCHTHTLSSSWPSSPTLRWQTQGWHYSFWY